MLFVWINHLLHLYTKLYSLCLSVYRHNIYYPFSFAFVYHGNAVCACGTLMGGWAGTLSPPCAKGGIEGGIVLLLLSTIPQARPRQLPLHKGALNGPSPVISSPLKKIFPAPPRHMAARGTIHICENSGSCHMQGARPRHTPRTDIPLFYFYFKFLIMYL